MCSPGTAPVRYRDHEMVKQLFQMENKIFEKGIASLMVAAARSDDDNWDRWLREGDYPQQVWIRS